MEDVNVQLADAQRRCVDGKGFCRAPTTRKERIDCCFLLKYHGCVFVTFERFFFQKPNDGNILASEFVSSPLRNRDVHPDLTTTKKEPRSSSFFFTSLSYFSEKSPENRHPRDSALLSDVSPVGERTNLNLKNKNECTLRSKYWKCHRW